MKIWIDGRIVGRDEALIPVLDHGLLYGDGIFEGMRVYGGRVFRLEDHLHRLHTSAKAIHLELPGGTAALRGIVLDTVRAHGADDAYIRLIVTRGTGELGVDPKSCERPRVICIVDQVALYPAAKLATGLDLVTVSVRRAPADVLDPRVKSLNYLTSVLAKLEARQRGGDEALLLNSRGLIAEASGANIFLVRGNVLLTPALTDGVLGGITRQSVLELAGTLNVEAREISLGRFDMLGADEAFLTGSGARIVPVRTLDGEPIGEAAPGPMYARVLEAFDELVQRVGTAV
jgi:branched-chain amino acid aminotransferase